MMVMHSTGILANARPFIANSAAQVHSLQKNCSWFSLLTLQLAAQSQYNWQCNGRL